MLNEAVARTRAAGEPFEDVAAMSMGAPEVMTKITSSVCVLWTDGTRKGIQQTCVERTKEGEAQSFQKLRARIAR